MKTYFLIIVSLLFALESHACSLNKIKKYFFFSSQDTDTVQATDTSKSTKIYYGSASFYSKSLEGTKTSNDEIFSHTKLTCASNRFKLGTWLRVTNISNNKSIIVRVNDRMHPKMDKKGRIVDLSYLGAKKLGFLSKGVTKVKVEIVPKGTKQ